jgi:hypothetical protein
MKAKLFLLALCIVTHVCGADFHSVPPEKVGRFLESFGLKTRPYRVLEGDSVYSGSSPYLQIGSGDPLPNNLAFYISGEEKRVAELRLVLNLNSLPQKDAAIALLAAATDVLLRSALDDAPIADVGDAIRRSASGVWKAKNGSITLRRIDWRSGGYELQLVVE